MGPVFGPLFLALTGMQSVLRGWAGMVPLFLAGMQPVVQVPAGMVTRPAVARRRLYSRPWRRKLGQSSLTNDAWSPPGFQLLLLAIFALGRKIVLTALSLSEHCAVANL